MDRRSKLVDGIDLKRSIGAEIGALSHPVVSKSDGTVYYVDYADAAFLREKYKDDSWVITSNIVEVDAIWGEYSLQEALGPSVKLDYVVASHVIEHVPDLIGWLSEVRDVLKQSGQLRLAVPDRRFTFDLLRTETHLSDVLATYVVGARVPQPREVIDFALNAKKVDVVKAWAGTIEREGLESYYSFEMAMDWAKDAHQNGGYHDAHCWIFTPRSFAQLFIELASRHLAIFKCVQFVDTEPNEIEFFVSLAPCVDVAEAIDSWQLMASRAKPHVPSSVEDRLLFLETEHKRLMEQQAERLIATGAALDATRHALFQAEEKAQVLEQRVAAMERSSSWRVTRPLRSVAARIRSLVAL